MQLKSARITNFKCVEDSNEFKLDRITCLVGKNEAGKTSILRALYKLNPCEDADGNFDKDSDYPRRHLMDYSERHGDKEARVLETKWEIEDDEMKELAELVGPTAMKGREVVVTKGYGTQQLWTVGVDEKAALDYVLTKSDLYAEEVEPLKSLPGITEAKKALEALGGNASERQKAFLAKLKTDFERGSANRGVIDALSLPKFLYFSSYDRMNGQVALEEFQRKTANKTLNNDDRVFQAFLDLVGVKAEDFASAKKFEPLVARLEAVSTKVSKEIFEYWTQNRHLKVQFRLDAARSGDPAPYNSGQIMRTRVLNTHHDVTVSFDDRSTGFVWFYSFLVLFSQVKKIFGNNLIILLDEPGLSLHAKAQADLLRYFNDRIKPNHQLIYSTHSPFMVPSENLLCVRTVEDIVHEHDDGRVEIEGTKVGDEVLSTDKETTFPLQGALGYEITQSLFIGKHTLLLEGPSDILYLKGFSEELRRRKRTALDLRWTPCPAGGVDKVAAFMSLFGGNSLNVALFVDFAHGQKKKVEDLKRSQMLKAGHVLTADMFAGQAEADTEDLIGRSAYAALVNETYALPAAQAIKAKNLPEASPRTVVNVEAYFRTLPPEVAEFDHYRPALHLVENQGTIFQKLPDVDQALDRFEKLFVELNKLLPKA